MIEYHGDLVTPHVDDMGPLLYLWFDIHEELEVVTVFQGNHPQMALS